MLSFFAKTPYMVPDISVDIKSLSDLIARGEADYSVKQALQKRLTVTVEINNIVISYTESDVSPVWFQDAPQDYRYVSDGCNNILDYMITFYYTFLGLNYLGNSNRKPSQRDMAPINFGVLLNTDLNNHLSSLRQEYLGDSKPWSTENIVSRIHNSSQFFDVSKLPVGWCPLNGEITILDVKDSLFNPDTVTSPTYVMTKEFP